ncbi:hypothetical protein LCGC14_0828020 [marine sediment metagenome]|uniref:Uncharacterized protein n=1 Tax=marine sediment metagenome TaxID=412755 RepID=A0A0F9S1P6_9ZZZZ
MTDEELVEEARRWASGEQTLEGFYRGDLLVVSTQRKGESKLADNGNQKIMKERALLFLDRRIGTLETAPMDHAAMAEATLSYAERRRVEAGAAGREEKNATELEAMQWIRGKLLEMK